MTMQEDRPATLRRSAPRPSPIENVDPIDTTPPAAMAAALPVPAPAEASKPKSQAATSEKKSRGRVTKALADEPSVAPEAATRPAVTDVSAQSPTPTPFKRRGSKEREVIVQLNSKISLKARDTLDAITEYDGRTIRSGVETGIYLLDYLIKKEQTGEYPVLEEMLRIYEADD